MSVVHLSLHVKYAVNRMVSPICCGHSVALFLPEDLDWQAVVTDE